MHQHKRQTDKEEGYVLENCPQKDKQREKKVWQKDREKQMTHERERITREEGELWRADTSNRWEAKWNKQQIYQPSKVRWRNLYKIKNQQQINNDAKNN